MPECPVCERPLSTPPRTWGYENRKSIECPRCGNFEIADPLTEESIKQMDEKERMGLSAWLRTERPSGFVVTNDNLGSIRQSLSNYRVSEKQLLLLRHLEDLTSHPGAGAQIDLYDDFPVIWASNDDELLFHLKALEQRGLIENVVVQKNGTTYDPALRTVRQAQATITTKGWDLSGRSPRTGGCWESSIRGDVVFHADGAGLQRGHQTRTYKGWLPCLPRGQRLTHPENRRED